MNLSYPRLRAAVEAENLGISATPTGRDEFGKTSYEVRIHGKKLGPDGRVLEVITTWNAADPGYECLAFMLLMAHEMMEDRDWCARYQQPFDVDGYYIDHNDVYTRLRWVFTDAQIVEFTTLADDDEQVQEQESASD